ncbi:prestin-like isoform X2 [Athalia rosae]|uniref:prestin-like isoform X2 n=1 Tax=Athalia rosae TaxID=37344 RepID=UPI002033CE28|nr:prestin-like isoform X2 [Athalia rosae]
MTATIGAEVKVRRPVYQLDELQRVCDYIKPKRPMSQRVGEKCRKFTVVDFLKGSIPLIEWLPKYEWKRDIAGDLAAGVTVAVMHIPQGMAYAILGNVSPVMGIYMAFFPVLVYLFLGSSKHNSMGSFALICLMTGKVVSSHSVAAIPSINGTDAEYEGVDPPGEHARYSATEVATTVTFAVAMIQLAMHVLKLGAISIILSDALVSGFTTGAAMHVLTSQIKDLFGLQPSRRNGIFKIIMTYVDLVNDIDNVNVAATVLSVVTILVLIFNNEVLKPLVAKRCSFPVPIEMFAVLSGTLLSTQMDLARDYGITTVGEIPVGLPTPSLPPLDLIPAVLVDSLVITIVSYTVSMSMAITFARRNNYEVDSNQELLAQGAGNLVGSFFSCMPFTASLSRSMIQETVGGKSQLASLLSCGLLLCVLLWVGPFFEPLPRCVLASIIVVALKGMLAQVVQLWKFWCLSRIDAVVWTVTFVTVVFLDIEYGLLAGTFVSLASLLVLSLRPYVCRMGLVPGTEIYLDMKRYRGTVEVPGIRMLHYCGGLNFASRQLFRNEVYKIAGVVPQQELIKRNGLQATERAARNEGEKKERTGERGAVRRSAARRRNHRSQSQRREHTSILMPDIRKNTELRVLVLDLSALVYVDPAGVEMLRHLVDEFLKINVTVHITGCSGPVYETIRKCNNRAETEEGHDFTMFPTIGDAVNFELHERISTVTQSGPNSTAFEEQECTSRL